MIKFWDDGPNKKKSHINKVMIFVLIYKILQQYTTSLSICTFYIFTNLVVSTLVHIDNRFCFSVYIFDSYVFSGLSNPVILYLYQYHLFLSTLKFRNIKNINFIKTEIWNRTNFLLNNFITFFLFFHSS